MIRIVFKDANGVTKSMALNDAALNIIHNEPIFSPNNPSPGTTDYTDLSNKPSVNGVTLVGNKTSDDLHISGSSYNPPENAPWFVAAGGELPVKGQTYECVGAVDQCFTGTFAPEFGTCVHGIIAQSLNIGEVPSATYYFITGIFRSSTSSTFTLNITGVATLSQAANSNIPMLGGNAFTLLNIYDTPAVGTAEHVDGGFKSPDLVLGAYSRSDDLISNAVLLCNKEANNLWLAKGEWSKDDSGQDVFTPTELKALGASDSNTASQGHGCIFTIRVAHWPSQNTPYAGSPLDFAVGSLPAGWETDPSVLEAIPAILTIISSNEVHIAWAHVTWSHVDGTGWFYTIAGFYSRVDEEL